ncbi:MAG: SDR family oxidoreductase, partial [Pseudonocardiaceae bacterium]
GMCLGKVRVPRRLPHPPIRRGTAGFRELASEAMMPAQLGEGRTTSGQDLGPMRGEVAYAASKGALASIARTLADHLADQSITLNTINPGPVDTGYAPLEVRDALRHRFPQARWGVPDDPARLIAWLATDDAAWVTGQTINTEGGFRRWD